MFYCQLTQLAEFWSCCYALINTGLTTGKTLKFTVRHKILITTISFCFQVE